MYERGFFIQECVSNNAFSFQERGGENQAKVYVPELISGSINDVQLGNEVVFADSDDNGELKLHGGLSKFVRFEFQGVPVYVFDNHNHALAFWCQELWKGNLAMGATLVHVDQHKDTRVPTSFLTAEEILDETKVFEYTNSVLNVGNFIPAAWESGLVKDTLFIDSASSIETFYAENTIKKFQEKKSLILDIDLDFFAPELDYIENEDKLRVLRDLLPLASVVTVASSPFFIEQELAIQWFHKIFSS